MSGFLSDIRLALRLLRKSSTFTLAVMVTMALGVGANTAVFSVVRAVLLRPLPYHEPERLAMLWKVRRDGAPPLQGLVTLAHWNAWRSRSKAFKELALLKVWQFDSASSFDFAGPFGAERLRGSYAAPNFFHLLGVHAALGRVFADGDANSMAVISDGLWHRAFGGDPAVVGKSVDLVVGLGTQRKQRRVTIIGVLGKTFSFTYPLETEVWLPLTADDTTLVPALSLQYAVVGRLADGLAMEEASRLMSAVADEIAREDPVLHARSTIRLEPMHEYAVGRTRQGMLLVAVVTIVVLLISCLNIANLLLGQAVERRRELSVKVALGASRGRLIRQLLTETFVFTVLGGSVGVCGTASLLPIVQRVIPASLPRVNEVRMDAVTLLSAVAMMATAALIGGMAPALYVFSQKNSFVVQDRHTSTGGLTASRWRRMTTIAQITVVMALLVTAVLLGRTIWNLQHVPLGFSGQGVLAMEIRLLDSRYAQAAPAESFRRELLTRARSIPGVKEASSASTVPIGGTDQRIAVPLANGDRISVYRRVIEPNYLGLMQMPLYSGRPLTDLDSSASIPVALISQSMARLALPGQDPVGMVLSLGVFGEPVQVVGVVGDVRQSSLNEEPTPAFYVPRSQDTFSFRNIWLLIRSDHDVQGVGPQLRAIVRSIDPGQPIGTMTSVDEIIASSTSDRRSVAIAAAFFAVLALALAMAGLYGVVARNVLERTREIGIRLALGARSTSVVALVVRQGMAPALVGMALGFLSSLASVRLIRGLLFGVAGVDFLTLFSVSIFLATTCGVACYLPGARASRLNPLDALRQE